MNTIPTFVSIINLGGNHWVTLVITTAGSSNQFKAYYYDSFGNQLPSDASEETKNTLRLANDIIEECITPLTTEVSYLIQQGENNPGNKTTHNNKKSTEEILVDCRKAKNALVNKPIDTDYIMGILKETLEIDEDNIRGSKTKQQKDGHNCGIFALENAHNIVQLFNKGKSLDEIDKELSEYKPNPKQKRDEFAEALSTDEEWKDSIMVHYVMT